jgi:hypothetical protein
MLENTSRSLIAWRFRAICLDCVIAIALTTATAATGKEFSDFLTLGMPKFTKLGAYYYVSRSLPLESARGTHHLSLPVQGVPATRFALGWEPQVGRDGVFLKFLTWSAIQCHERIASQE